MKRIFKDFLIRRNGILRLLGAVFLQLTKWQYSKFLPLRYLVHVCLLPVQLLTKDHYYNLLIYTQKLNTSTSKRQKKRSPRSFFLRVLSGDQTATPEQYLNLLKETNLSATRQITWSNRFMEVGRIDLSRVAYQYLLENTPADMLPEQQLQLLRDMGAIYFMAGNNKEATHYWQMAGRFRRNLFKPATPKTYRILGTAWFAAVGHVAMLDYYLKFKQLHTEKQHRVVAVWKINEMPAPELFKKLAAFGITLLTKNELEKDYDVWARRHNYPTWAALSSSEKAALVDDFWEYDFSDGEILGYAHAASRIQREWEARELPPLLSLSNAEQQWLNDFLFNLGMPRDAWYVCLHVREAGYHKHWNALYPSMRDADINDYTDAIKTITDAGGWVIRMGDASMKPLPAMHQVVDYAHTIFKNPVTDIILAAGCRFFLGTNSGFATFGIIYGVPCALSNWVPIGWPLWPSQDLMIPKLFRSKTTGNILNFETVYERGLAFLQNQNDLPDDIEVVSNTPKDIAALATEMMARSLQKNAGLLSDTAIAAQEAYVNISKHYGGFTGSHLGQAFAEQYAPLFLPNTQTISTQTTRGDDTTWQEQSNDNTTATSS